MKVSIDSRTIEPGDYFIPVKGPHVNGRDFIPDAIQKGGRLLDVDIHAFTKKYRKKLSCAVVAITGSAGKTTTKDILYSVLSRKYKVVKTKENQNNEYGVPLTLLSAEADTDICLVELGMRKKKDIDFLTRLVRPTHVIITNIGLAHIEFFKSQKELATAKSEIFLPPCAWENKSRTAFINFSTPFAEKLTNKARGYAYNVIGFSGKTYMDTTVNLCYEVGHHFSISDEDIQAGIASYESSKHRLSVSRHKGATIIDDTYNSNPDGVRYALEFLRRHEGRKILVFGDMLELGSMSEQAHKAVIEQALDAGVDILFTYGNESRVMVSEDLSTMHFDSKETLVALLRSEIKSGDVILVKGSRGLKMETIIEELLRDN